jgi:hypothetical protein
MIQNVASIRGYADVTDAVPGTSHSLCLDWDKCNTIGTIGNSPGDNTLSAKMSI